MQYGRLTVIKENEIIGVRKSGRKFFKHLCICVCGNKKIVNKNDLKSGHTKSCGCYRIDKRRLNKGESGFNQLYYDYKKQAKERNLSFSLTKEEFRLLVSKDCSYCGLKPSSIKYIKSKNKEHGTYLYNGIDRVNNDIGYLLSNCVTACSMCNIAKKDFTKDHFLSWIQKVYHFQKRQNNV